MQHPTDVRLLYRRAQEIELDKKNRIKVKDSARTGPYKFTVSWPESDGDGDGNGTGEVISRYTDRGTREKKEVESLQPSTSRGRYLSETAVSRYQVHTDHLRRARQSEAVVSDDAKNQASLVARHVGLRVITTMRAVARTGHCGSSAVCSSPGP